MNKMKDLTYLRKYGGNIKNIQVLIDKIKIDLSNPKKVIHDGDVVHAWLVRRFIETKKFMVTAVEISNGRGIDIDIELNNNVNIQVWYGASVSTHNIKKGNISPLGGVPPDWNKDEKSFKKKVNQLPNTGLGLVFCYPNYLGINTLSEWICGLPDTKAVVEIQQVNYGKGVLSEAIVHHSNNFKYLSLTEDILKTLGFVVIHYRFLTFQSALFTIP